jgi:uncharacterized protein YndB with AHSA1/START domain
MPTETIELSRFLPAPPLRIYDAWLDASDHAAMTGGKASVESREVGGRFTAWDGYIDGSHVALEPGVRIVQAWRSDDFPADALDSLLEVLLAPEDEGTRITIRHTDLPEGQGPGLLEGWDEHYLAPMERFFVAEAKAERAARRKGKGAGKKVAAEKKAATRPKARARPARTGAKSPAALRASAKRRAAAAAAGKKARRHAKVKRPRRR